ncbi:MAG: hypothetical protein AAAC47_06880 [Pararhizobium sp.]
MAVKFGKNAFNYTINFGVRNLKADFLGDSVQKSNAGKFKMNAINMHSINSAEAVGLPGPSPQSPFIARVETFFVTGRGCNNIRSMSMTKDMAISR